MENIIKFDRQFMKLHRYSEHYSEESLVDYAILLDAHPIEKPSETYIRYDSYVNEEEELFPIDPYGKYILLIFYDQSAHHTFLTLRKDNKENRLKFFKNIGEEFAIEIQR